MGEIWIKEFVGGLDTRRMPETTQGGALIRAQDGHINRGGEFEQRAAFVKLYTLLAGTKNLAAGATSLYVFGHGAAPVVPSGVTYQRLRHPDNSTPLTRVLSYDLFSGLIYAIALFDDGNIFHFYNGVRVTDWNDGLARCSFRVAGGTASPQSKLTSLTAGGVEIVPAADTNWATSNEATATVIANRINAQTSNPDYTAEVDGDLVTITSVTPGPGDGITLAFNTTNGFIIEPVAAGTFQGSWRITAGTVSPQSQLSELKVGNKDIINATIDWKTSDEATAAAISARINAFHSSPEYTATVVDDTIQLALVALAAGRSLALTATVNDGFVITPSAVITTTFDGSFTPGDFARTIGSKVYALSGSVLHFSGIRLPTGWTARNIGSGFIDMASIASGAEVLQAVEEYQEFIAIFAERVVLIYFVDPDPTLNRKTQVLRNTGTRSPKSIVNFGDADLFYLDASGVRSLKARDASNSAATTDIGVPIDTLIVAKLETLSDIEKDAIEGLIEPTSGRFWLVVKDIIFVFSYFGGSKVSAWSTYLPTYIDEAGVTQSFNVDGIVVFDKRVYLRSGDDIFVYGGPGNTAQYDATEPELWTPYLDGGKPAFLKTMNGIDVACEGEWEVHVALDPSNQDASDKIGTVSKSTFNAKKIPANGEGTHISLRFIGKGIGPKKLGSALIHYDQDPEGG